jgi:hypothetical protein
MGLYTIAFVSFGMTNAFCAAIFPRLARNTRHIRELKERYEQDEITGDEYEQAEVLEKSKISSLSMVRGVFAIRGDPPMIFNFIFAGLQHPWRRDHTVA